MKNFKSVKRMLAALALVAFAPVLGGSLANGASFVKVTIKQEGKVVGNTIYSGPAGGKGSDHKVYWKLLAKPPMFGSEVVIKPDESNGKTATLEGKLEISIAIRNRYEMGTAKVEKLRLTRRDVDSDKWFLSKDELKRVMALVETR